MSEDQKQAVVEDQNTDATPSADETSAQEPSLDELLKQFEEGEPKQKDAPKAKAGGDEVSLNETQRKKIIEELRTEMAVETEIKNIVAGIKEGLDVEEEYVRWKLDTLAAKDERVWKAFIARNTNPKAWDAIVKSVKTDLHKTYGKAKETDKEKISAAVRSATTTAGSSSKDVDVKKMSEADFEHNKERILLQAMKG